jgi:hypothetical protein
MFLWCFSSVLDQNEFLDKKQPCFLDHTDGRILELTNSAFFFILTIVICPFGKQKEKKASTQGFS